MRFPGATHPPLNRQQIIYWERFGVWLPRQSLSRWTGCAADWLKPVYELIRGNVLEGGYVQIDETPIRYLAPGHGQTRQGYLWTCHKPGGDVFYQWKTSRAAECLESIVPAGVEMTIGCDGYAGYPAFAKRRGGTITLAGCWAHVRRAFFEAREEAPRLVGWILQQIRWLYALERRLRENRAGPRLRQAVREAESGMILRRLHRALRRFQARRTILPRSGFGKAVEYALEQWPKLWTYVMDGRVEIDNNACERAIRPTAIGKKNWLFIGEAEAGERSAILYTIIESCRRRGINAHEYLKDVLTRLPSMTNRQIAEVTPEAWARTRARAREQAQDRSTATAVA
mgnify:CR=1 FL=1